MKSVRPKRERISYGEVIITRGRHRGRIGYYDDDEEKDAVVYIGDFFTSRIDVSIPRRNLRVPTMAELLDRMEFLRTGIFNFHHDINLTEDAWDDDDLVDALAELNYIEGVRMSAL